MQSSHHNWIDGALRAAASGESFEIRVAGSREPLGRWPRSNARDLDLALAASVRDAQLWSAHPLERRRQVLSDAIDELLDDAGSEDLVGRALGLVEEETDAFIEPLEWALDDVLDGRAGPCAERLGDEPEGPLVLALDWSEMWLAPAHFVFKALLEGRSVIAVSDPRSPAIADSLARALAALPRGSFQVVHDDGRSVLRAALDDERVACVHLPSTSDAEAELVERDANPRVAAVESGFGAGIERARASKLRVRSLQNQSLVVRADLDLRVQAEFVCERAFARVAALSGARPGRIGRALIPKHVFSAFTEVLLEAIESNRETGSPLHAVRVLLAPHVERAFALGHDEGATAIFTGHEKMSLAFPLVFTNVEERMRLARLNRPSPVLCLMRVASEELGHALAARLDA